MIRNQTATTEQITAWNSETVSKFVTGDADVLMLERSPLENLAPVVEAARLREYYADTVTRQKVGFEVRAGMHELKLKSAELEADLIGVMNSFLNQFALEKASLRLEVTQSQPCPKFHCDNVNVRLVTTYLGPCTEYQYSGEETIHAASLGGLLFLKGHQNPTYRDLVHHRSPQISAGQRRLCVAIDY